MTITVRSNEPMAAAEPPVAVVTEKTSAPEAEKQPEQKEESTESETVETENEEAKAQEDEADSEESEESEGDKPKKKSGFKRRIDKLSARVAERERELEYWKAEALKQKQATEPAKEQVNAPAPQGKPNPDNYDSHAEYVEALTDWKVEQKYLAQKQEEEKNRAMTEQQKAYHAHVERVKSFSEKVEDFDEVIASVDDIPVSVPIQNLIVSSQNGPELMYELAKNKEEFARICKLPILEAVFEIGAIKAKIASKNSEEKNTTKKITAAPAPVVPVGKGKASIVKSIDDPNLSQSEYERLRAEQMKKRA